MCKKLEDFTEGNLKYLRKKVTYQSFPPGVGGRATPRDLTANTSCSRVGNYETRQNGHLPFWK